MQAKIIIAVFCASLFSSVIHAEYSDTNLQKLFTDKKQRSRIDAARSGTSVATDTSHTNKVKVSGYLTRSDGKSVVWLNNKNTLNSSKMGGVRVHQSSIGRNNKVTITVDSKSVRLKPGETWSEGSGISDKGK